MNAESIKKYIGQTITVFIKSGGESGMGFTGILADVNKKTLKLITQIGSPPECPLKNSCRYYKKQFWFSYSGVKNNQIGSVTEILLNSISSVSIKSI